MFESNCFVAGTEVITGPANGQSGMFSEKPIQDIQVGDEVLSRDQYNPNAPEEEKKVVAVYRHTVYDLRNVTITTTDGKSQTLDLTGGHKLYIVGLGWTEAQDVKAGEHMLQADGSEATITANIDDPCPQGVVVYNFQVADDHTYFVSATGNGLVVRGDDALWVHNTCAGYHHFVSVALGSEIPRGDARILTYLSAADHTDIHAALNDFLEFERTTLPSGEVVDMWPRAGNSGADIRAAFTAAERIDALTRFYTGYKGGKYLGNFLAELSATLKLGAFK